MPLVRVIKPLIYTLNGRIITHPTDLEVVVPKEVVERFPDSVVIIPPKELEQGESKGGKRKSSRSTRRK